MIAVKKEHLKYNYNNKVHSLSTIWIYIVVTAEWVLLYIYFTFHYSGPQWN